MLCPRGSLLDRNMMKRSEPDICGAIPWVSLSSFYHSVPVQESKMPMAEAQASTKHFDSSAQFAKLQLVSRGVHLVHVRRHEPFLN